MLRWSAGKRRLLRSLTEELVELSGLWSRTAVLPACSPPSGEIPAATSPSDERIVILTRHSLKDADDCNRPCC